MDAYAAPADRTPYEQLSCNTAPLDAHLLASLDALRALGYVILKDVVPSTLIDSIQRELEPWFEATPHCQGDFYGWHTTRLNGVLLKSPSAHALLLHPMIATLVEQVLGPHCDTYQLNLSQAIRLHPGERQQVPHRDDEMWPCPKHAEFMVNVLWALTPFTRENGATRLWPRSQFRVMSRAADAGQAIAAEMLPGSSLIYLGSTTHCGGANRSASHRTGLIFSYSLGWLRPYENASLTYPPAIARQFAPAVRQLIGYRLHRPNLGHYEGQDPSVALETHSRSLPMIDALPPSIAAVLQAYYATDA